MKSIKFILLFCIVGGSNLLQAQLYIDGVMTIQDQAVVYADADVTMASINSDVLNDGSLILTGDLSKAEESTFSNTENGICTVTFSDDQVLDVRHIEGDFTGDNSFNDLVIELATASEIVDVNSDININNSLSLTEGILRTDTQSFDSDGSEYRFTVFIDNSDAVSLVSSDVLDFDGPYVEGRLNRRIGSGDYEFPVGVSRSSLGKQSIVISTDDGSQSRLSTYFQEGSTTQSETSVECDLGESPDFDQPDGFIETITIDCSYGQWISESDQDYEHSIAMYPSDDLTSQCTDAVLMYAGVNGEIEDCPSFTSDGSVSRGGLFEFGVQDIATSSLEGIVTSTFDIDGKVVSTKIFPNPSNEGSSISIELSGIERVKSSYSIHNLLGQLIKDATPLENGVNSINTSNMLAGQYLVRIDLNSIIETEIIVIR